MSPTCEGAYFVESSGMDRIGRKRISDVLHPLRLGWILPVQV